jgi:hypothetical protein
VGSIITHLASCLDMGDTSETGKMIREDLTQSAVNSVGALRDARSSQARRGFEPFPVTNRSNLAQATLRSGSAAPDDPAQIQLAVSLYNRRCKV